MKVCPHANVVHCPLYVAAHAGTLCHLGCDDGRIDHPFDTCGVGREVDYHANLSRLIALDPRIVAECAWREDVAQKREQRDRNMRLNGVH